MATVTRAWSWLLMGLVSLSLLGCCPRRPERPFSRTAAGQAALSLGIDGARARQILTHAPSRQLQEIRQLLFLADLPMASGSEHDLVKLQRRVQHELAEPLVISHNEVAALVDDLTREARTLPRDEQGRVNQSREDGWETVSRALSPALGALPSTGESLQRVMTAYQPDLAVASLYQAYVAGGHYHDHNFGVAILRALSTGGAGDRALPLYAQVIRDEEDSTYSTLFREALSGARQVLGADVDAWYWEVQGRALCRDLR